MTAMGVLAEVVDLGAETFDDYVRRQSVALQRFAYLITRNHEDARDCVQDALLGLFPRWESVSAGNVDAYVRRSIVNASVSRWRRSGRTTPVPDPAVLRRAEPTSDPTDAFVDAEDAWALCGELPPTQRAAVVLRFYHDLSFAEIAEVLECPEATARSHCHRALTTLRTRLIGRSHP